MHETYVFTRRMMTSWKMKIFEYIQKMEQIMRTHP